VAHGVRSHTNLICYSGRAGSPGAIPRVGMFLQPCVLGTRRPRRPQLPYTSFESYCANLLDSWTKAEHDEEIRQWTQDMSSKSHQEFEKSRMTARIGGVIVDGRCQYATLRPLGFSLPFLWSRVSQIKI
jgi:hypothetical protein